MPRFSKYFPLILLCMFVGYSTGASLDKQEKYHKFTENQGLYAQKDDVEILTISNFKDAVVDSKRAWFVEFYNSWCGFCQRFAPSWKDLATDIRNWRDVVVVAAIDCSSEQNYPLCRDYEVMGYPTLRYFHEGFKEEPKNYGSLMNRGSTAIDHRQELVAKMVSEQNSRRGQHFPNLLPFTGGRAQTVLKGASSDVQYAILIVQEPMSLLGPEVTMDFHKIPQIVIRYSLSNNTDLVTELGAINYPAIYVIDNHHKLTHLPANSNDRQGFVEAIKKFLKEEVAVANLDLGREKSLEHYEKEKETDTLMEKVKRMGNVVFQMDLESALRYSLKREVGSSKDIQGAKLVALWKYVEVLEKHFPFGRNGKILLTKILQYVNESSNVEGVQIARIVKEAEGEDKEVFSTPQKWLGCLGSTSQYRGYPCGLWTLFHYLTANVGEYSGVPAENPRVALEAMHGYIKYFFGCTDCSQHFQEMAARRELDKVASSDDAILWLWMAHNEVNKRLSGDVTEDPEHPKIQFPSSQNCPKCRLDDDSWNFKEVLKYLKNMYSNVNIRYLGADTKVIYLAIDGASGNATYEGIQEEDVQIQARPVGEGVADAETNSGGTTKDKATVLLSVVFLLTCLRVERAWQRGE